MEMTGNPKVYLDGLMAEANGLGMDPELVEEADQHLKHSKKEYLRDLMHATPDEFYDTLLRALGSSASGRGGKAAWTFREKILGMESYLADKPQAFGWLFRAIKFVVSALLGVVKFTWDTLLIGSSFVVRTAGRAGLNLLEAGRKTIADSAEDAVAAGKAIGGSFTRNILTLKPAEPSAPLADEFAPSETSVS